MTDKQHDTRQDTQKAAGELQGAHTEGRRIRGQAEERGTDGHAPGEWRRGTERNTAAGREQAENRRKEKRVCNIFKGERREKTPLGLTNTCKHVHIYCTKYRGVWAVYCTFFYILEGYYIYLYIYIIPINVYFSFKVNVYLDNTLLYG